MLEATKNGTFPAAQLLYARKGEVLFSEAYGKANPQTLFDLASLTKAISTATLCLMAFQEKKMQPSTTLREIFPEASVPAHQEITVLNLLEHNSGLAAWKAFYLELPLILAGSKQAAVQMQQACLREDITHPVGSHYEYSDIGFLLLGFALEKIYQKNLAELFAEKIQKPLQLQEMFFLPFGEGASKDIPQPAANITLAPTQDCPWRGQIVQGRTDDANAYMLGGVAGHAGLFANAPAVHNFLCHFRKILKVENTLFDFKRVKNRGDTFLCGWNLPSKRNSSAGKYFSKHSLGHLGFTGCSMWMDLEKDLWVILLTNRVHPDVNNQKIKHFRPLLHDAVLRELAQ